MVRKMLAAAAAVLFVIGVTIAAKDKGDSSSADQGTVNASFVKFDADKNEITVKVGGKDEKTFKCANDVKVAVGEVKELKKLKEGDAVMLTVKKDGDKYFVTEVKQGKGSGSARPRTSKASSVDKGSTSATSSSGTSGTSGTSSATSKSSSATSKSS